MTTCGVCTSLFVFEDGSTGKSDFPDIAPGFGPARVSRLARFTHLGGVTHDAHEGKSAGRGRFGGAAARPCTRGPPRETRDSILEDVSEHEF